jgi:carbon monoxide dehydrogenase subunit G
MKLEQSFEVHAPIDVVWVALNDLERVAPCLPGAAITGHDDDGTYHGEFKVKLGPTTAAYKGTIKIQSADEATHTATLAAKGSDKRGQGGANATIVNTLVAIDGGTRVDAVTDFAITGRLARFGRGGMIQDISNRLLRDFATCLATRLGEGAPTAPTGAEVTAGDAPPEAVAAAAPEAATGPSAAAAAASAAGSTAPSPAPPTAGGPAATPVGDADSTDVPAGEYREGAGATAPPAAATGADAGPSDAPPGPVQGGPPPATHAAGGPARTFSPPPPSEPLKAGSLFWSVLWERIKAFFGRGKK